MAVEATKQIPFSDRYAENYGRVKLSEAEPCIVCGKGIKVERAGSFIAVDITANAMLSPEEAARRQAAGDDGERCSYYPVGSDCARRADVRDYVQR